MKEQFIVNIINTRTQSRSTITSTAETLGQLKQELSAKGIDFEGMTFMEGATKVELKDDASILPTNVPVKRNGVTTGETTNNLALFLTAPDKHIKSGVITDRKEAYAFMKEHPEYVIELKNKLAKHYTNLPTAVLLDFCNSHCDKTTPKASSTNEVEIPKMEALHTTISDKILANVKTLVEKMYKDGTICDSTYTMFLMAFEGKEVNYVTVGYSCSDIDAMYGDWMR